MSTEQETKRVCPSTFEPLHENMFEDAVIRRAREDEAGMIPVSEIMHSKRRRAYIEHFKGQIGNAVPAHIITEHLVPYMRGERCLRGKSQAGKRLLVQADAGESGRYSGFYIGLDENDKLEIVTDVESDFLKPLTGVPEWPTATFNTSTMQTFSRTYMCGFAFYYPENATPEEIERRFWILVFNRVFGCAWWHFEELDFVH